MESTCKGNKRNDGDISYMISIYTVILNYNNYEDTKECIDSIKRIKILDGYVNEIILVDNCSTDKSGERLRQLYKDTITYLQNDTNCGYAVGNNIGIKYAIKQGADYICVLNNDTVADEDFLSPCIEALNRNSNIAFISPTIENYNDGLVQSTGGDIFFEKAMVTVKNSGAVRYSLPEQIDCDYIGGACLIFKSDLVNLIGFIPENYFLFFEETEWCWRAKKNGMRNICLTTAAIKHKGSASINSITGLHAYLMERNRVVFLIRNAPSRLIYLHAIAFLMLRYIKKGILDNPEYFNYLRYMNDGRKNRVDKRYPFVYIRN